MVDFPGSYHAILGRPCYAKFMAISNYTYLKLKMLGPNDVITVGSTFLYAYTCNREHYELATAIINSAELPQLGNSSTLAVLDCNKPTSSTTSTQSRKLRRWGSTPLTQPRRCGSGPSSWPNRNTSSPTFYAPIAMSLH